MQAEQYPGTESISSPGRPGDVLVWQIQRRLPDIIPFARPCKTTFGEITRLLPDGTAPRQRHAVVAVLSSRQRRPKIRRHPDFGGGAGRGVLGSAGLGAWSSRSCDSRTCERPFA